MMGNKFVIMGLGFLLTVGMLSPLAMGENDSLYVILTVEDRNYSVGDTISIQMRIYNQGALTNVASISDITMKVSTHHNFNNPMNLTLTSQSTGVYTTTYTIKAADNNQNLYFFYEVTLSNDHEKTIDHNDALVIPVYSIQDTVDISFDGQEMVPARPGDMLSATILTRTGTVPIPVTGFTQLYVETPDGVWQNLSYTTQQDGIYTVEFTVPQVSISGAYEIVAQPMGMGDHDSVLIYVNVLDVWCHKISTAGTTASFEVCVADLLGLPVEGANFVIQRGEWPNDLFFGITNASGKAMVSVLDVEGTVGFSGWVLAGGLNQTISGAVTNPVAEQPDHNGFDIMYEGVETGFEPGTEATLSYGAYNSRLPAASTAINYYVTAGGQNFDMFIGSANNLEEIREVLITGQATTNAQGKFSITFDVPETQCAIHVRLEVPLDPADFPAVEAHDLDDIKYYDVWPQNNWDTEGFVFYAYEGNLDGDGEVGISGGSFKPGKAGTVSVDLSAGTGDPVMAMWGIGEGTLETIDTTNPAWTNWVPAGYVMRLSQTESGKYEGTFMVPEFIEDQDVTIISGYMDSADGTPHFDSKTVSPGGGLPWLWIIIVIIVIIVVIVVIVVVKERF